MTLLHERKQHQHWGKNIAIILLVSLLLHSAIKLHHLTSINKVMYHVMAGLDMSNLAAMFGGGGGLGGLAAGAPPVQDPETAYASQLTQLQAGDLLTPCSAL